MGFNSEYSQYDALGLAELIRTGQVSRAEVLDASITCIEAKNPQVNAVIQQYSDRARDALANLDPAAVFAGVPFLLKDLLAAYQGEPLRNGCRAYRNYVAPVSAPIVERYLDAGLVIVGKTNTPEFGITPTTEPELSGATNNPWKLSHSAGGSSGGAAAAVAAGMVPAAHAGDGGGSIRIPASCCGLFGLKPSRGRMPESLPYKVWMDGVVEHAITRSAA